MGAMRAVPAILLLLAALAPACGALRRKQKPNMIFIITDDQSASFVGGDWYQPKLRSHMAAKG